MQDNVGATAYEVIKMIEAKIADMDPLAVVTLAGCLLNEVDCTAESARMLSCHIDIREWAKKAR